MEYHGFGQGLLSSYSSTHSHLPHPAHSEAVALLWYQPHMGCRLWVSSTVVVQCQEPLEQRAVEGLTLALHPWGQL